VPGVRRKLLFTPRNLCGAEAVTAKLCREARFLHERRLPEWTRRAHTACHARCGAAGGDHDLGVLKPATGSQELTLVAPL
jgi:hypothetical protein